MSNNGAALLGGLLIGGLVVGAAMSAENAAERQNQRNHARYNRQQQRLNASTFCICGAKMVQGRIQQGVAKCNNLNCQRVLTGSICYYCPKGGNVQQHTNGFFYCQQCALQLKRGGQVIQKQPIVQQQRGYPAQQNNIKRGAQIVKQGYMSKRGNWFNTAYKKRYFKLWSNKKMAYLTHPGASYTKGYADFTAIKKMEKKGKHGLEVTTNDRVWSFLCQSEQDRNDWFMTIQRVCMGIQPQIKYVQPPQPQVQYVPAPQPQVQYVPAPNMQQPALPNNGNMPQYQQPQQPMYRGSVIEQPSKAKPAMTRPKSHSLQPGMVGYDVGDMYGKNNMNNNNIQNKPWEDQAPPAAFAASAPPEEDVVPSAPPMDDEQEGNYTGK